MNKKNTIPLNYETKILVRFNKGGKIIGEILECSDGFFYKPKGVKNGGDVFPTLSLCKLSLEEF